VEPGLETAEPPESEGPMPRNPSEQEATTAPGVSAEDREPRVETRNQDRVVGDTAHLQRKSRSVHQPEVKQVHY